MKMASMCILLALSVIFISIRNAKTDDFSSLDCKAETLGQYGRQSLLECVVKFPRDDTLIRVVAWKKADRRLLVFADGKTDVQPGYSFAEPSWNVTNVNVSLLITNTALEHTGVYTCMVFTDRGDGSKSTSLNVRAKYNKPTIRSRTTTNPETGAKTGVTLTCDSSGGYPKGELRWYNEQNAAQTVDVQMEATKTESGLFNLSSELILRRGPVASKYTCRVFNASGGNEEESIFEVAYKLSPEELGGEQNLDLASKIVAPVVVTGSVIAGVLLALLIYRRQSGRHHHSVSSCESDAEEGDLAGMDETCQDNMA